MVLSLLCFPEFKEIPTRTVYNHKFRINQYLWQLCWFQLLDISDSFGTPMDFSTAGSYAHEISQARILEGLSVFYLSSIFIIHSSISIFTLSTYLAITHLHLPIYLHHLWICLERQKCLRNPRHPSSQLFESFQPRHVKRTFGMTPAPAGNIKLLYNQCDECHQSYIHEEPPGAQRRTSRGASWRRGHIT